MDFDAVLNGYVNDLNAAVKSREFPPFVMKWFDVSDCKFHVRSEENGKEETMRVWQHILPIGLGQDQGGPREVIQVPYKVEGGRVYSWRELRGGGAPKPMYGLQETEFDDRTLICDIRIQSVQDKPEVDEVPNVMRDRLARVFLAFADSFNDFFETGDPQTVGQWCTDDVHMVLDSTFWNMGVIGPHNRINPNAEFTIQGLEPISDDTVKADVAFVNWGGLAEGRVPWEVTVTPEGKIRALDVGLVI
jgi:hypothetical protein